MKIGKLYIKIFLSFVLILLVTEILIIGLFLGVTAGRMRERFAPFIEAHAILLHDSIESRLELHPDIPIEENEHIRELIDNLTQLYSTRIWISSADGRTLLGSDAAPVPQPHVKRRRVKKHFIIHETEGHRHPLFVSVPFDLNDGSTGHVNFFFQRLERRLFIKPFLVGLAGIGAVVALLLLPVSRLVTRPLEKLKHAVQKLSAGNLHERAEVRSNDEIGELVRAFNRMADTIERMITGTKELTANVSHELRSPLARIRVTEELLRQCSEGGDLEGCREHLEGIRTEIGEMDILLGQILTLSKLDLQPVHKEGEFVDVGKIMGELLTKYRHSAAAKSINVEDEIGGRIILVKGTARDIEAALSNLFDNAVKFTPEGGTLSLHAEEEGEIFIISLVNTCAQRLVIDREAIFEPFVHAKDTKEAGHGLGLAIAKKVAENHGGSLTADQRGDRFTVELRLPMIL